MNFHLNSFKTTLKTLSPIFVGSGIEVNKKEYLFIPTSKKIIMPNLPKLFATLENKGLLDDYTNFMLSNQSDLYYWLNSVGIKNEYYNNFTSYEMSVGDALDENHSLKGIQLFIKDKYGLPYIPGSSLKGAIRTAILSKMLSDNKEKSNRWITEMIQTNNAREDGQKAKQIEVEFLHTLNYNEKRVENEVNSIMRGVQISDSNPLSLNDLVLCKKIDLTKNGNQKPINNCRECIKPGVTIEFMVTFDKTVLKNSNITKEYLQKAIIESANIQNKVYSKFAKPSNFDLTKSSYGCELYLGGGSGFISKTFVYAMNEDKGLVYTSRYLHNKKRDHHHDKDLELGVSPHTLKCTSFGGKLYQMGRCEVKI